MKKVNKKKLKTILFIMPYFYPAVDFGGPITATLELACSMVKRGFRVIVLTTDLGAFGKRLKLKSRDYNNIEIIYSRSVLPKISWNHGLFLSVDQFLKAFSYVRCADVVHFQDFYVLNNFLISLLCKIYSKNYIITPHGSFTFNLQRGKSLFKRIFFVLFMRFCVDNAKLIHVISKSEMRQIKKEFTRLKTKIKYIPNLIPHSLQDFSEKKAIRKFYDFNSGSKLILFLGRIAEKKGVRELLNGYYEYIKTYKNRKVYLIFAGPDAGELNNLRNMTQKYNLKKRVIFTGTVGGEFKRQLLYEASLLCLLSYSEGMATVILEAASLGTPAVFTKECHTDSLANSQGGIITTRSANSISFSIGKVLKNRGFYSKNAKKWFLKNFSYSNISDKYEKLYNKLG